MHIILLETLPLLLTLVVPIFFSGLCLTYLNVSLYNFSPLFLSHPTILEVSFDRIFCFLTHISRLRLTTIPRILKLKSISSLFWGCMAEFLSLGYCSLIRSTFLCCSSSWFPYASKTSLSILYRLHSYVCRIIASCISSSLTLLYFLSFLPSVHNSLTHSTPQ